MDSRVILTVLAILLVALAVLHNPVNGVVHRIAKRRLKPRLKDLTLRELEDNCRFHLWNKCSAEVDKLLNKSSPININFSQCVQNAHLTRVQKITLHLEASSPPSDLYKFKPIQDEYPSLPTRLTNQKKYCLVNRNETNCARGMYCNSLKLISLYIKDIMVPDAFNYALRSLAPCLDTSQDPGYFTPQDILQSIEIWLNSMQNRRLACCPDLSEALYKLPPDIIFKKSIPLLCPSRRIANSKWSYLLTRTARCMKAVEMLESLGRRRKCLRGCVGIEEVNCIPPPLISIG